MARSFSSQARPRGAGRAIAVQLDAAGPSVCATGFSTREQRSEYDRPDHRKFHGVGRHTVIRKCPRRHKQWPTQWYRSWYHEGMAMNLRLTDEDTEALRAYAAEHGMSMQQAAVDGIRQMLHDERRTRFIRHILDEDRDLLHRLAQ